VRAALFSTPRPEPGRLLPAIGGGLVIALALPVFALAGWPIGGWALGAVLWLAVLAVDLLLASDKARTSSLAASGVQAFGLFFKAIAVLVVLLAAAVTDSGLAASAVIVFVLAYTLQLGLSLLVYFGGSR
jgi:hypothetical protein